LFLASICGARASAMLRILFTRYREGVDPKPTLKKFEALAHVSAGLTRVQWGEPSGVSPFDMGAVAEAWSQCIVFTFASAEALEHFTTSVDHEELWTECVACVCAA
jgi:hypothetical protein